MRFTLSVALAAVVTGPLAAQEMTADCAALYAEFEREYPVNLGQCVPREPSYSLSACEPPHFYDGSVATTHLILAIDASGSMAGAVGGETKMAVAQREALAFLNEVHPDVNVALVVYGHEGNNQEEGRALSCASSEMIHPFDANRRDLEATINSLTPTGWTPLGGVLEYSGDLIDAIPTEVRGEESAAVVYLISDGEETCGGDPVGAATALANMGIQASVNTIGFAVDAETEAQLQAIAAAGGGQYYPAETANALQAQLRAIQEAEASLARYDYCVALNAAAISGAHQAVVTEMVQCYGRNDPTDRQLAIIQAMRRAEREERPEAACADELNRAARSIARENRGWMQQNVSPLQDEIGPAIEAYRDSARLARRE